MLEENEILVKEIPKKTKLKDDLEWSQSLERKYTLWKTANIKFLNLKESTLKVKEQENELVKFWEVKGGKKVKENWEKDAEAAANEKEIKLKEILEKKKSAKSRKRKVELIRECKDILTKMLLDWRMTLTDAEERHYLTLKERLEMERKECNVAEKMTSEDDLLYDENCLTRASKPSLTYVGTSEKLRGTKRTNMKTTMKTTPTKQKLSRPGTVKNSPVMKNMVNMVNLKNLPCVKSMAAKFDRDQKQPPYPQLRLARVCGNLATLNKVTKPSYICSRVGVQNQIVPQWTGPASQWGVSKVPRPESIRPIDQSEGAQQ